MSQSIKFTSPAPVEAAAAPKGPAKFTALAYLGGKLEVGGFDWPVVIDLAGLTARQNVAVNLDHVSEKRVGHVAEISNDGERLLLSGVVSAATESAREFLESAKSGFPWGVSVEASPDEIEEIPRGESVQVNGQSIDGPVYLARKATLTGIGLVSVPADAATSVSLAAKKKRESTMSKESFDSFLSSMLTCDPSDLSEGELASVHATWRGSFAADGRVLVTAEDRAAVSRLPLIEASLADPVQAEERRLRLIRAAVKSAERDLQEEEDSELTGDGEQPSAELLERVAELAKQAVAGEIDLDQLIEELQKIRAKKMEAKLMRAPQPIRRRRHETSLEAIEAKLLVRAGRQTLAEKHYSPRALEAAHRMRSNSFVDLCAECVQFDGRDASRMNRNELIRAGFSTTSLPTALSNLMGKILLEDYREHTASWRGFAKVLPAADFKPQVGVRPSFIGQLDKLPKDGQIIHGQLDESTYPWQIATFAKMLTATRQDVINDDLRLIQQTAPMMAKMAARSLNDLVWSTIMANAGDFFHAANNKNLLTTGSVFGLASLASAVSAMRKQRDAQSNDIDIMPKVLAVPPELEVAARGALNSAEIQAAEGDPMGNALKGIAELVVESRLSNTDKFDDASTSQWFLFAAPQDAPIIVGFLDGLESPTVETFGLDHDVNTLGFSWRVYHDFGCALGDHRAAVKATGEAGGGG